MDGENATNVQRVVRYHHGVPEQLGCSLTGRATDFDSVGHVPCEGSTPSTLAIFNAYSKDRFPPSSRVRIRG